MALPVPHLDDRHFQQLVDDAKRLVQQRCPEWSDHNVSDPGVTLIEAFAQMVDQLVYRLNRVPERHYVKFLELLGLELHSPAAARGEVTFWLSAPRPQTVHVREGVEVSTDRTDVLGAVVFSTTKELEIVPCSFSRLRAERLVVAADGNKKPQIDLTPALDGEEAVPCFSDRPLPGEALLIGLSNAVPSCAVRLQVECPVAGIGVDVRRPPLRWEAHTPDGWVACALDADETGGFNRSGTITLHVPPGHRASVLQGGQLAGWLRCSVVPPQEGQWAYEATPRIRYISAATVGGTVGVVNAEVVCDEVLGRSDGTPGQRFPLARNPVIAWEEPSVLLVRDGEEEQEWHPVPHFADSGAQDRHYRIDPVAGEVHFGPAVREADGSLTRYGATPPPRAVLRLAAYRVGGGRRGNVARSRLAVLKSSVPYVHSVLNRDPTSGGADIESLDNAKLRAPVMLRARGRAVTAEDFVELARDVAPGAARLHCIDGTQPGEVRLLVVPEVTGNALGYIEPEALVPRDEMLTAIRDHLDARRLIGTRLVVTAPRYERLTVIVEARCLPRHRSEDVRDEVLRAVHRLLDPIRGGPDGRGWPFGCAVHAHMVHAALAGLPGLDLSREVVVHLYPGDADVRRKGPVQRLDLAPDALVQSFDHQAMVEP